LTCVYGFEIFIIGNVHFRLAYIRRASRGSSYVLAVLEEVNVAKQILYIIVFGESLMNDAVSLVNISEI
jgi:hypothetical protein